MTEKLDEIDLQILKTLQKNAKLTTKELAEAVHLTPTPVFERQKRLEKNRRFGVAFELFESGSRTVGLAAQYDDLVAAVIHGVVHRFRGNDP